MADNRLTYQISFSGGMGSAISALIAKENGLDFNLIFADTLIEDEDLYRFCNDISAACGKEIITLCDGRTPWQVFVDKRYIGNSRTAHCSGELKTDQVRQWLSFNAKDTDPIVLGMDWSEMDRIERAQRRWDRPVVSLLNQYRITRDMHDAILKRYGIEKPRLYKMGWSHNNCGGFCVKGGQVQMERLLRMFPERYAYHEKQMDDAMQIIGSTAKPFLRITLAGDLKYVTLKEFRELLETNRAELPMFDAEGCGCFTDDEVTQ